ncbi:MAG: flippase-like domain-containing protein [Pirellulales bacterium]|nr:flippase-like domain-containing protein [Pirellulales bacterium]
MSRRTLLTIVKFAASALLIGWLVYQAISETQGSGLDWTRQPPRSWTLLLAAWFAMFSSLVITIVRWHLLVRALDIPFRLRDAFRLGFLGYMLNFVSLGSVGGDLFRAIFIAREAPDHRAEAVATVLIDRIIGLYVLFVIAGIAIFYNGLAGSPVPEIQAINWLTWVSIIGGAIGIVMLLVPGFTDGRLSELLSNLPKIGPTIGKLLVAVRIYRQRIGVLFVVTIMTVAVHVLGTLGVYYSARGLLAETPTLAEHFVIVPLAMVASALPLPLMGLGAVEAALKVLYAEVPVAVKLDTVAVLKIAVVYRVIQILDALAGGVAYLFSRRQMSELMHEAEYVATHGGEMSSLDEAIARERRASENGAPPASKKTPATGA